MLVCVRICPYQSWQNVAEHNYDVYPSFGFSECSLAQTCMSEQFKQLVKGKNTLTDIRQAIKAHPELQGALQDSMSHPLTTVGHRFQTMKSKGQSGTCVYTCIYKGAVLACLVYKTNIDSK